jgi:HK97 gp10 family phage protein
MKLEGLKELEQKLIALGKKDGSRAIRSGVLAAGKVILARARQNAAGIERGSGALALSLGARFVREGSDEVPVGRRFVVQIGPRANLKVAIALYNLAYRRRVKGIYYGHLIERGYQHVGGKRIPGRPFLRPALQQTQAQAINAFRTGVGKAIDRIVKKKAKASG